MKIETTELAKIMAIQNSALLKRGPNEGILAHAVRCYEADKNLKRTVPDPVTVKTAVHARLDATRAKSIASQAVATARQAVKAVLPSSGAGMIARRIAANAAAQIPLAAVSTTAEEFKAPQLRMELAEFNRLTPADKMRFVKSGGKLQ